MISAESAIHRARRDLFIGSLLNRVLFLLALVALAGPMFRLPIDTTIALTLLLCVWVALGLQSMRSSRMVADFPQLIARGEFEAAEESIDGALKSFSIFRGAKLISLHHLAALRHAQKRWRDAAALCRAVLEQRRSGPIGLRRATQGILADSLLEMNDLPGVSRCIGELYRHRLSLGESMNLMLVQLDYESRISAWPMMVNNLMTKVSIAELMPTPSAARAQALLALAAVRVGRNDWADWLKNRIELLIEPEALCASRPVLQELWRT